MEAARLPALPRLVELLCFHRGSLTALPYSPARPTFSQRFHYSQARVLHHTPTLWFSMSLGPRLAFFPRLLPPGKFLSISKTPALPPGTSWKDFLPCSLLTELLTVLYDAKPDLLSLLVDSRQPHFNVLTDLNAHPQPMIHPRLNITKNSISPCAPAPLCSPPATAGGNCSLGFDVSHPL